MARSIEWEKANRFFREAIVEYRNDRFERALNLIDRSIELRPAVAISWTIKGRSLYEIGDLSQAEKASQRAVELNPNCRNAWITLGLIYGDLKRFERAASSFKRGVDIKRDASILTLLAAVEYEFDPESARQHAQMALDGNPEWEEAQLVLEAAKKKSAKGDNG